MPWLDSLRKDIAQSSMLRMSECISSSFLVDTLLIASEKLV